MDGTGKQYIRISLTIVSEGEDTVGVGHRTLVGDAVTAETILILHLTAGAGAVSPLVGDHLTSGVELGGAPGSGGVSIGALVIPHSLVYEWELTQLTLESGAE